MNDPIAQIKAELKQLLERSHEIEVERAALQPRILDARRRLSAANAEQQRLEHEPQDNEQLERLTLELRNAIAKAPSNSPSAKATRELLSLIEAEDSVYTVASALRVVKEALRGVQSWPIRDRNIYDNRLPPLAGRGG